jgi:proteasome activator subunit 4
VAQFLSAFHYNHSALLYKSGAAGLVQRAAETLLRDPQAEVREQAKSLLQGLLAAAVPSEAAFVPLRDRYVKLARVTGDAPRRRAGVLALAALVLAFPYQVPRFLPPALVELARNVAADNGPVAKAALSEFRRTHQDDWAEHKRAFDPEQLGEIDGVLVSPDYYA